MPNLTSISATQAESLSYANLRKGHYSGLATLLANPEYLANLDKLDDSSKIYINSCADCAMATLSNTLETVTLLVDSNRQSPTDLRVDEAAVQCLLLDLNTAIAGMILTLADIIAKTSN